METKVDLFNSPMVFIREIQTESRDYIMPSITVQIEIYPETEEDMQIYYTALQEKIQRGLR